MGVGEVVKEENAIIETFTVKASTDILPGQVVYNDGTGILPAVTGVKGPYFMAMWPYDHTQPVTPDNPNPMPCLVVGIGDCLAVPSQAIKDGEFVKLSATAGSIDYDGSPTYGADAGIAMQDFATTDTHGYVLFGHR